MYIYKITNLVNNKIYIGQTIGSLSKRMREHLVPSSSCTNLARAIKKYGKENFIISSICRTQSIVELNHRESYYIKLYDCLAPNGYNLRAGGENHTHSEESKLRMSVARKGKKLGKSSWNKGKSSWSKGLHLSEQHRNAIFLSSKTKKSIKDSNGIIYPSISAAAKILGTSSGKICAVIKGKRKSTKGLTFEVINVNN